MPTYYLSANRQSVQEEPFLLQMHNGSILALWTDLYPDPGAGGTFGVYGRALSSNLSAAAASDSRINSLTEDIQRTPTGTSFSDGGFAVIFESRGPSAVTGQDDAYYDSYIRFYNADGTARGAARQLTPNTTDDHYAAGIVTLANGQSVTLVARYEGGGDYDLLAYRHGPGGARIGPAVQLVDDAEVYVNSLTGAGYIWPSLAAGVNGTYAVSWQERTRSTGPDGPLDGYAIWTQVYRADGSAVGPSRVVAPVSPSKHEDFNFGLEQSVPKIAGLTTGRWALAWEGESPAGGDVWFRLLNPNGAVAMHPFLVNSDRRVGEQTVHDVVDLGAGRVLVTYFNYVEDAIDDFYDGGLLMGRVLGPNGAALTGSFRISESGFYHEMSGGNALINNAGQIVASFEAELSYADDTDVLGVVRPLTLPAVHGNAGNNRIAGTYVNDVILGQGGNDVLHGNRGNDSLYGGMGNDTLWGEAGNDLLNDVAGNNVIYAGAGHDRVVTGAGVDRINAGAGNDRIVSGAGADQIFGLQGNDTIDGGAGNDILTGGAGNDVLRGGPGNDILSADAGNDILNGGAGNDMLRGGVGADLFIFSDGADTIRNFDRTHDRIDLRSFSGLDSWADVRGQLRQEGGVVTFRHGTDVLRIEATALSTLGADDFLW